MKITLGFWLLGHIRLLLWLLLDWLLLNGWWSRLDVMRVDKLLNVQKRNSGAIWWVQQILQNGIQLNTLAILQTLLSDILVHLLSHLGTRNLLVGTQLQKCTKLVRHIQWLVEAIVGRTRLGLLAGRILKQGLDLAQILAQGLDFRLKIQKKLVCIHLCLSYHEHL